MKIIRHWKAVAFAVIVSLLLAGQPAVTFACETVGSHCGG